MTFIGHTNQPADSFLFQKTFKQHFNKIKEI